MSEAPIRVLYTLLLKSNLKHVKFITIKDNTQKAIWTKIGKVNDWIRRYSDHYYIVRGLEGGIHFHLVALLRKDAVLKVIARGVHFNIQTVGGHKEVLPIDEPILEEMRKGKHIAEKIYEKYIRFIPQVCLQISCMIKKYWLKKSNDKKKFLNRTIAEKNLSRVFEYLQKNLDENPEANEYLSYLIKLTP